MGHLADGGAKGLSRHVWPSGGSVDRSARRILADVIEVGLLGSDFPKSAVGLCFRIDALDVLLPRLFAEG
jgi:hypothetical protein